MAKAKGKGSKKRTRGRQALPPLPSITFEQLRLLPETIAAYRKLNEDLKQAMAEGERRAQASKELDRQLAIRDGLLPPPWMQDAKTARARNKKKPKKPPGRPRDYNRDGIAQLTKDYIRDNGCPRTATLLREKVADACEASKPHSIEVPKDTVFKAIVNPMWRRYRAKSRKVGN